MFVTTNTYQRQKIFQHDPHAREAIECLYRVQELHPFFLHGFVIMPDHCHLLMYIPAPESISVIMKSFKGGLGYDLGIKNLWQPRFLLRTPKDGIAALDYIHNNPLKAGLVQQPENIPGHLPQENGM
jgi:putative transposase